MASINIDLGSQHPFPSQFDLEKVSTSRTLEHQALADVELVSATTSTPPKPTTHFDVPSVSPLSHVRMSESTTTVTVARHPMFSPEPRSYSDCSPYSSNPSTAVNSRAPSPSKDIDDECDLPIAQDRLKWRLASGFFACFIGGWADGVTGTVMPYLSKEFHLTSTMSSSLFAGTTCGFFLGTFLVESIITILSRSQFRRFIMAVLRKNKTDDGVQIHCSNSQARHLLLLIASIAHAMYFVMMGSRSGFPVMFLAYVVSAFSRALLTAPLYAYFAEGPKQALGYGLGSASLGSVISPLVCQSIIATGVPWYRFYYGSLVLSILNIGFLFITFKPTSGERIREYQKALSDSRRQDLSNLSAASEATLRLDAKPRSMLRLALVMPYQWAVSFFIMLYCGSETLTQGFMVTFLLSTRHANPKTIGYVTSGFWGGISFGRFIWGYCVPYLSFRQRKYAVQGYIGLSSSISSSSSYTEGSLGVAVVMHLLIWFMKSAIQDAVYTSIIGLLYGPIFPACLSMANDILPAEVHMVAMALISSFASLGGAIFPLMAGAIFDAKGISKLTYVTVPVAAAMACLWALFPSRVPTRKVIH